MSYEGASNLVVVTLAGVLVVVALLTGVSLGFLCARRSAARGGAGPLLPTTVKKRRGRADWDDTDPIMLEIIDSLNSLRDEVTHQKVTSRRWGESSYAGGRGGFSPPRRRGGGRRSARPSDALTETSEEDDDDIENQDRGLPGRGRVALPVASDVDDDCGGGGGGGGLVVGTRSRRGYNNAFSTPSSSSMAPVPTRRQQHIPVPRSRVQNHPAQRRVMSTPSSR